MIYTVTLNPALDYVIQTNGFTVGAINRTTSEHLYFGGKGINVSWILKELDTESTALGFTAGFTGAALESGLKEHGIRTDFVEAESGMTRINVKLHSGEETEINGTGPYISEQNFENLLSKVKQLKKGDLIILSGSIPSCMKEDTYERIVQALPEGVLFAADAEKKLLLNVIRYRPFLIKPNHIELADLFNTQFHSEEDIIVHARRLQEMGARNVLVSMAGEGAMLIAEDGNVYRRKAAKGTVVNSVGAGDSMTAGFTAGWLKTGDYAYALKLGTACGGATAFHSGLASAEEIREVFDTLD
ncbi:MAG: 1-phosphofructokinase [Solobacterium sp.]|nr:1-phosphofructokinase [Solobacterium sp.]